MKVVIELPKFEDNLYEKCTDPAETLRHIADLIDEGYTKGKMPKWGFRDSDSKPK